MPAPRNLTQCKNTITLRKAFSILFIIAIFGAFTGCSTQKIQGVYSPLGKAYHNTTARYNGYYNATVLLDESYFTLNEQLEENFNQVLPVYPYREADNPEAVAANLDLAIEKVSVVAALHPGSNWTDDCYLLAAKCQYLKQDYESAEEMLEYMTLEYSPEAVAKREKEAEKLKNKKKGKRSKKVKKTKKKRKKSSKRRKKKKKSKPSKKKNTELADKEKNDAPETAASDYTKINDYFMKHRPAYQEGLLWLARVYTERDRFREASSIILQLKTNDDTYDDIKRELAIAESHYYLIQKRYTDAIPPLEQAVKLAQKRTNKARYNYILGQLYLKQKENIKAYNSFVKARKFSSNYDMEFNALLNMEQTSWARGGATPDQAIQRLEKMLKDDKNIDYAGQIYFTMAQVALEAGRKKEAIKYLEESVAGGTGNTSQKTESYYLLASLYFEDEDFVNAKYYFDQTLSVMLPTDERRPEVEKLALNLEEIAQNIQIITLQDSLLRISRLSENAKLEWGKKLLKERKKAAEEAAAAQKAQAKALPSANNLPSANGKTTLSKGFSPSNFFAYNQQSIQKGQKDFERKWGDRILEDNWRRSNRTDKGSNLDQPEEEIAATQTQSLEEEINKLLESIPQSPTQIQQAHSLLENALFVLGTLYRDKLENNQKCIETLEILLNRYPQSEHRLQAMYYLYVAHNSENHTTEATKLLNTICSEYPESIYCKILLDPSYAATIKTKEKERNEFYEATFLLYEQGNYYEALSRCRQAIDKFGAENPLQSKFDLLASFSIGHVEGQNAYVDALKDVVAKYPSTAEEARAKEILRILGELGSKSDDKEEVFIMDDEDPLHFCIVVINDPKAKLNDIKVEVSDFNSNFFSLDRIRISSIYLGTNTDTPILVLRRFTDIKKAMSYFKVVDKNKDKFIKSTSKFEVFMVNQHNYRQLIKQRSLDGYAEFFNNNYL